jgi:HD-GYP domain-containing protein (c-di-GMP phosphodiesterase class II)
MDRLQAQVLGALSHALDITEGQPRGHSERTAVLARRLASRLGLPADDVDRVVLAALLKDAGCSSNAAKVAALYGNDDAVAKQDRKTTDHLRPLESVRHLLRSTAPGGTPAAKLRHLRALAAHGSSGSRQLTALRCDRGAEAAAMVGLDADIQQAIRDLDEHWDGRGYPVGLEGDAISLFGRILCLAQTLEVFWVLGGPAAAVQVADERSGTWFDPHLVALLGHGDANDLWEGLRDVDPTAGLEAPPAADIADEALDRIASAFATIVDAKSAFTASHSTGVAEIARDLAVRMGRPIEEQRRLHRAGLLHDIGKLGVSNRILDKPGKLDDREWTAMRRHPELGLGILGRVDALRDAAWLAAVHHERLDGSGYFRGLDAQRLSIPARIIGVADVAEALTADRPYREGLPLEKVLAIIKADAGVKLDGDVVEALEDVLTGRSRSRALLAAPTLLHAA